MNRENQKLLAGFILGFTAWLPFLFLAYNLSPYKLVVSDSAFTRVGNTTIPMWGWQMVRSPFEPPIEGSYMGWFAIVVFYIPYGLLVVAILMVFREKETVKEKEP